MSLCEGGRSFKLVILSAAMTGTKVRKTVVSDAETAVSASETILSATKTIVLASKTAVSVAETAVSACETIVSATKTIVSPSETAVSDAQLMGTKTRGYENECQRRAEHECPHDFVY